MLVRGHPSMRDVQVTQRFDDAEGYFASAVKRAPYLYEAWNALIRVEIQLNKLDAADVST